ncbi:hypothetical protein Nmel_008561, partial [Mimus melanotis]
APGTACARAAGRAAPRAPFSGCPGTCGRSNVSAPSAPSCPGGAGAGAEGGDPKSVPGHGLSADPRTELARPAPHLSGPAGSAVPSARGVSAAVPGEGSGEMAASPRPPRSDMARAGSERTPAVTGDKRGQLFIDAIYFLQIESILSS